MSDVPARKRPYSSPIREQKAAETRRRVIDAAADVFTEQGFGGTTMRQIADRAGLSPESVYATGSKAELLMQAFQQRYVGEAGWESVFDAEEPRSLIEIDDPEAATSALLDFLVSAHRASAALMLELRTAAALEPLVAESWDTLVAAKRASYADTARWLVRIGVVETPVRDDEMPALGAALNIVMSAETYVQLTRDWEMDESAYRAWVSRAMRTAHP